MFFRIASRIRALRRIQFYFFWHLLRSVRNVYEYTPVCNQNILRGFKFYLTRTTTPTYVNIGKKKTENNCG